MLRSILIALDATPASSEAQRLAIDMAKRLDAQVTGLAVLDRAHIASPAAVRIGGMAYKQRRDRVNLEEAKSRAATARCTSSSWVRPRSGF